MLGTATEVKFYYDDTTHWITDNVNSVIATVPGNFQDDMGCSPWDPGCLQTWLQDPDGDGIYGFSTSLIRMGSYEAKVAINESWDENYGVGGEQNGANIQFVVPYDFATMNFSYDPGTHILSISAVNGSEIPEPTSLLLLGTGLGALGLVAYRRRRK